jgi:hypothetical protein
LMNWWGLWIVVWRFCVSLSKFQISGRSCCGLLYFILCEYIRLHFGKFNFVNSAYPLYCVVNRTLFFSESKENWANLVHMFMSWRYINYTETCFQFIIEKIDSWILGAWHQFSLQCLFINLCFQHSRLRP